MHTPRQKLFCRLSSSGQKENQKCEANLEFFFSSAAALESETGSTRLFISSSAEPQLSNFGFCSSWWWWWWWWSWSWWSWWSDGSDSVFNDCDFLAIAFIIKVRGDMTNIYTCQCCWIFKSLYILLLLQIRASFRQDGLALGSNLEWGASLMSTSIRFHTRAGEAD